MNISNSGLPGGVHSDVLTAKPSTTDERTRLVEELKRRAKLAIVSKRFPEAEVLYSKAIEVLQSDGSHTQELSIIYSNRSLCYINVGKYVEAKDDAMLAVELDQRYVKALFRLGSACLKLNDGDGAVDAFQKALDLGENAALEMELSKAKKLQSQLKQKEIEDREKAENQQVVGSVVEDERAMKSIQKTRNTKPKNSDAIIKDIDAYASFSESDHIRGYKIVNGKKTSFFHHEQTDEEKRLIGDIAPKMIDSSQSATLTGATEKGVSAWNKAGTWEEKNVTRWAIKSLEEAILSAQYKIPGGSLPSGKDTVISVKQVKGLDKGHASIATVRGKRRNIFEFTNVEVCWEVCLEVDAPIFSGLLILTDIDGTCEGEYDITYTVDVKTPGEARHLLDRFVKGDPDGLRGELIQCVNNWVALFDDLDL